MKAGGGKSKGAAFEREICVKLSLWVSGGKQEDCFWRSAVSGGRSTVAHAKGKRLAAQAGDISCIHPIGAEFSENYMVECKHYADLNFSGLASGVGHLVQFWEEASAQAQRYAKHPLLIAKQNRCPTLACTTAVGAGRLNIEPREAVIASPKLGLFAFELEWFFGNAILISG